MTILLVDDNDELRSFLACSLRESSLEVAEAATSPGALALAKTQKFDAVVVDSILQGEDGLALIAGLKDTPNGRTPVLLMSEISTSLARRVAKNAGCNEFLVKPFGVQEFVEAVRQLERARR